MIVTYSPEGGEAQTWEFNPGRVRMSEAEIMQKRFGGTWEQFKAAVMTGDIAAQRVVLWHLLRRDHHTLRFEDIPDFYVDELLVERTKAELQDIRSQVEKSSKFTSEEREALVAGLDVEIEQAPEGLEGKASSQTA